MRQHRTVVSDEAWGWMEPLLPSSAGRRGGRWRDHRQVIEAIAWKYRTGSPWREVPEQFGPRQTAYERLTRWSVDGTWAKLLARAQADADAAGELDWLVAGAPTLVRGDAHGGRTPGGGGCPGAPPAPDASAATPRPCAAKPTTRRAAGARDDPPTGTEYPA